MTDMTNVTTQAADALQADVPPIMIPEKFVAAVFDPFKKKFSAAKRAAAKVETYDITTTAGMGQAKELRASFRDVRTAIENERKSRKAPIIAAGKLLDARAAEITAEIEPFESQYDREIKAEEGRKAEEKARKEAAERARVEAIEGRIARIRGVPGSMAAADSAAITKEIDQWTLLRLDPDDYQEYLEDALTAVNTTLDQLGELRAGAEAREAEQRRIAAEREELARYRAEQEQRDAERLAVEKERERLAGIERQAQAARQAEADAAAAEQVRKMEEMRAEQERSAKIMEAMHAIQRMGSIDGDVRTLSEQLELARNLPVTERQFGQMVGMAQMMKDAAVASIEQRYAARIAAELPDAHAEALDMNAIHDARRIALVADILADEPLAIETEPMAVDTSAPIYERPSDAEMVNILCHHYSITDHDIVIEWLRDFAL